jgi:predicted TIM-barrel fold metal-dependent hydrolase
VGESHLKEHIMIIDCSGSLPTAEFFLADVRAMRNSHYLTVFGPGCARWVGMEPAECSELISVNPDRFVDRIVELAAANGRDTMDAWRNAVDAAGIDRSVLHNFHESASIGPNEDPLPNDRIAEICAQAEGRLIGFAGVDPLLGAQRAAEETVRTIRELGLAGIGLRPFRHRLNADDRAYYPIYEQASALRVPVWVHCSVNYDRSTTLSYGRPLALDQVACDFPNLTILAGHGGWPFTQELVAIAMRHPNIYIDVSAVRHLHMPKAGSGWEPVLHFGNNLLQDQIVIGLDWLQLGYQPVQLINEIRQLPLRPLVLDKWLGGNAARIFD